MEKALCLIVLYAMALEDYRVHCLSEKKMLLFAILGIGVKVYRSTLFQTGFWIPYLPGLFLLLVGWATKEQIGYGDGMVVLLMGFYFDVMQLGLAISAGFFLAACFGFLSQLTKRKFKKIKMEIPYLPFLLMGTVVMLGVS